MRRLNLKHHLPGESLTFDWDPETGAISGRDAAHVQFLLERFDGTATLYGTQPVAAPDPAHVPADMAAILAEDGYQLPPDLARLLPPPAPIPPGAVA